MNDSSLPVSLKENSLQGQWVKSVNACKRPGFHSSIPSTARRHPRIYTTTFSTKKKKMFTVYIFPSETVALEEIRISFCNSAQSLMWLKLPKLIPESFSKVYEKMPIIDCFSVIQHLAWPGCLCGSFSGKRSTSGMEAYGHESCRLVEP